MKKKVFLVSLLAVLASSLIISGCARPAPGPTPEQPTPAPAPAELVELKFSHPMPPTSPFVPPWEAWAKEVEEVTGGQVKVVFYPASSLVAEFDTLTALRDGVIDIGFVTSWVFPELEFETLFILPSVGWTAENAVALRKEVEKEVPELTKARSAFKKLWLMATPIEGLHLVKKTARVPEDIKGLKFIGPPPMQILIQTIGAEAAGLPPPDHYPALEKGIVDGIVGSYCAVEELKLDEVTKVHLEVPLDTGAIDILMNLNKWNSLPPDIQQKMEGTFAAVEKANMETQLKTYYETRERLMAAQGHTVIVPTTDELAQWAAKIKPAHQIWIDNMTKKGYPAQEAYDKLMEVITR